jgi:hypothetical protein
MGLTRLMLLLLHTKSRRTKDASKKVICPRF